MRTPLLVTITAIYVSVFQSHLYSAEFEIPHPELKAITIDSVDTESFLSVRLDTEGNLFTGCREALFVYEANESGFAPRKLLFDIYHVSIMNGDVIRRLHQHKEVIGHIHTAGNPGRAELDDNQEINYPACMKALLEIGYNSYVGHEFIPTRDPLAGLEQAIQWCDV